MHGKMGKLWTEQADVWNVKEILNIFCLDFIFSYDILIIGF